jgi:hypothetical protein
MLEEWPTGYVNPVLVITTVKCCVPQPESLTVVVAVVPAEENEETECWYSPEVSKYAQVQR